MKVLINNDEMKDMCKRIGKEITDKYKESHPLVVGVLKGACPFHSELIKYIDLPIDVDYIQVSSYVGKNSSGNIVVKKDLDNDICGKDVIIVEDIVDTGLTLSCLKDELNKRGPKSLSFVSMLDKPSRRTVKFDVDYVGKTIEDLFVVGFGLDYNEKYRNLKDICVYDN